MHNIWCRRNWLVNLWTWPLTFSKLIQVNRSFNQEKLSKRLMKLKFYKFWMTKTIILAIRINKILMLLLTIMMICLRKSLKNLWIQAQLQVGSICGESLHIYLKQKEDKPYVLRNKQCWHLIYQLFLYYWKKETVNWQLEWFQKFCVN